MGKTTANVGKDGLKYSTGVNLSGFDPSSIASQFDDIDVRNGSQKFHFSRSGATSLNSEGVVHENVAPTLGKQAAVKTKTTKADAKAIFANPLVIAGGIGIVVIVGIVVILHVKK